MSLSTAVTIYVVNDYVKSIINHLGYIYRDSRSAQSSPPWTVDADADAYF